MTRGSPLIPSLQCLVGGKLRSGTCLSRRKQWENGTSLSLRSSASSSGTRSGTRLARRKQWVSGLFELFSLGAFGLLGKPPHS
jgi:hypothetical protein